MHTIIRTISAVLLLTATNACEFETEFDLAPSTSKLHLLAFPSNQDTTFIQVVQTYPTSGSYLPDFEQKEVNISYTLNGIEQEVFYAEEEDPYSIRERKYHYVLGKTSPGDKVELNAQWGDLPQISAETNVPKPFPLDNYSFRVEKNPRDHTSDLHITVKFDDPANEQNYYGLRVEEVSMYEGEYTYMNYSWLNIEDEPLFNSESVLDDLFVSSDSFYDMVYIWDDKKIDGEEYTMHLSCGISSYMDDSREYVRLTLYTLTPEFYDYLHQINTKENNSLLGYGLAPVVPSKSNVNGGFGLLGGCHVMNTEWIDKATLFE